MERKQKKRVVIHFFTSVEEIIRMRSNFEPGDLSLAPPQTPLAFIELDIFPIRHVGHLMREVLMGLDVACHVCLGILDLPSSQLARGLEDSSRKLKMVHDKALLGKGSGRSHLFMVEANSIQAALGLLNDEWWPLVGETLLVLGNLAVGGLMGILRSKEGRDGSSILRASLFQMIGRESTMWAVADYQHNIFMATSNDAIARKLMARLEEVIRTLQYEPVLAQRTVL